MFVSNLLNHCLSLCIFIVATTVTLSSAQRVKFHETSGWLGASYAPAMAPGNLWLWNYTMYSEEVEFELFHLRKHFGFNTIRLFLHDMVYYADNGKTLFSAIDRFLAAADRHGFKVSLGPFFDDCHNQNGASLMHMCVPVEGRHNGCWFTSPQNDQRQSRNYTVWAPYIRDTTKRYMGDPRIRFIEIFNEPHPTQVLPGWSYGLRDYAFRLVMALNPPVPVLSCWDDNNNTEVVDMHRYDTNFAGWTSQVYRNVSKGALITEGGSRWFQGTPSDAGSPLTVAHWYHALQGAGTATAPFPFGMILNWEMMVGKSNTRWHWGSKDGSPEPAIPWDGWVFSDGTPVSYTEAAVARNFSSAGSSEFLFFQDFLPPSYDFVGDQFLTLHAGQSFGTEELPAEDYVVETTIWPLVNGSSGTAGFLLRSATAQNGSMSGYFVGFDLPSVSLILQRWEPNGSQTTLRSFSMASLDCGLVFNGWNMLRAVLSGSTIRIYANPMALEAYAGGIRPRIEWTGVDQGFMNTATATGTVYSGNKVILQAGGSGTVIRFDFLGVLPLSVL